MLGRDGCHEFFWLKNFFGCREKSIFAQRSKTFKTDKTMEMKNASAGTLESGDILIRIAPSEEPGLHIDLTSSVAAQFGGQIRKVIAETLGELGIDSADIQAVDKGALDCTIRARVTAAAVRATGKDVWK